MIKIALAQINPTVGDIEANADKIISYIRQAQSKEVDIVVFPELALLGYPPQDLLFKPSFIEKNLAYLKLISTKCRDIIAIVGFVDKKNDKIYNSCAVICDTNIVDIYHKIYLSNYSFFDEIRYFSRGDKFSCYYFKDYKFTISISEDIREKSFVNLLKRKKLDFVINISSSPFYLGKIYLKQKTLSLVAKTTETFVVYCNLVGGQDEFVFDGGSCVLSLRGEILYYSKRFSEDFFIFNLDKKINYPPIKISEDTEKDVYCALCLGLVDYVKKNGFRKVIIGVSGGIDSAVVASLATVALGCENVYGLIMPSRYTSKGTFCDAKKICENLKIKYYIVNIDEIFCAYLKTLKAFFNKMKVDKTEENIQARIRGNILMAFSNKFGYLVLNTGNKSELSCGYCTLYGDMVGGFGILKDVSKDLVYKIANYINKINNKNIIPPSVIKRAPSAELKLHQKDSDTLPPYSILDPILKLYIEDSFSKEKIIKKGFDKELVKKVINMVDSSEYKRRQASIGIKITPNSFGKDRCMPITNRFVE